MVLLVMVFCTDLSQGGGGPCMRTSAPSPDGPAPAQGIGVTRKGRAAAGIWLGLFAMLMIHVGSLYSALQNLPAQEIARLLAEDDAAFCGEPPNAVGAAHHHAAAADGEPAWLATLELCGYCELLTLNPPLTLPLDLALPYYAPVFLLPLPEQPLPAVPRHSSGHPRAPPVFHA